MMGGVRLAGVIMCLGGIGVAIGWGYTMITLHDYGPPLIGVILWGLIGVGAGVMTTIEAIQHRAHEQWWDRVCRDSWRRYTTGK